MQQQKTTSQLQEKILQLEKATQPKEHFRISQLEREIKNYKNEIDNYKILLSQFDFIKRENYNLKSEVQKKSQVKFILELQLFINFNEEKDLEIGLPEVTTEDVRNQ